MSTFDPHNAFRHLVEPRAGEPFELPEGDHTWLCAELDAYLGRGLSPLAVAIALLGYDFSQVAPLWAALAEVEAFQDALAEPVETFDPVTRAAFHVLVSHAAQLDELANGRLWSFLSGRRVAYFRELLVGAPGHSARVLIARHLLTNPEVVGAGWGDGPTAIAEYLDLTGDDHFAEQVLKLPIDAPASIVRDLCRRFPHLRRVVAGRPFPPMSAVS